MAILGNKKYNIIKVGQRSPGNFPKMVLGLKPSLFGAGFAN